jgi:hypothetical protein
MVFTPSVMGQDFLIPLHTEHLKIKFKVTSKNRLYPLYFLACHIACFGFDIRFLLYRAILKMPSLLQLRARKWQLRLVQACLQLPIIVISVSFVSVGMLHPVALFCNVTGFS